MRLTFLLAFLVFGIYVRGQSALSDTLIHLNNYTVHYSQQFKQPLEVWYKVKCPKDMTKRDSCITSETWTRPSGIVLPTNDVFSSQWHHGHLASVESFDCTCEDAESTMNMLNCAMQNASLNKGMWLRLENQERKRALEANEVSVYVRLEFNDNIDVEGVRIPSGFFKTLTVDGVAETYYFPNQIPTSENLEDYRINGYGRK